MSFIHADHSIEAKSHSQNYTPKAGNISSSDGTLIIIASYKEQIINLYLIFVAIHHFWLIVIEIHLLFHINGWDLRVSENELYYMEWEWYIQHFLLRNIVYITLVEC